MKEDIFNPYTLFATLLVLFLYSIIICIADIYEYVLFNGYDNTKSFRRKYNKRPFLNRKFLLTYFDKELISNCKYQKLLKKIFISYVIYLFIGIIIITSEAYFLVLHVDKYQNVYMAYLTIVLIFVLWYTYRSIRWEKYFTGKWRAGQREFRMRLPDEKKKKK